MQALLKKFAAKLAALEPAMVAPVKAVPQFTELAEIIESMPELAEITSTGLNAAAPELDQVSNNAALARLLRGRESIRVLRFWPL